VRLNYSAISDVGRVRKDNQDSGYVGPHLIAVCDGVGGAARGDIASSTAIAQLRKLDENPPAPNTPEKELLGQVSGALHRAHARIAELVDENPALNGMSTTATIALFDGERVGMGHVGDSRAYLFRDGEISQLTSDHTFVQTLIDEGRITEAESRVHPHRNLILKAVDGIHDLEPDLFVLEVKPKDRLLLCSDGASGVLDAGRLADILSSGTPDYAAVELVRASLEAGSSDNVTCLVADVVEGAVDGEPDDAAAQSAPLLVGAAAEMRARRTRAAKTGSLFRGHRAGDTGELEPIRAEIPDEVPFAIPSDPIRDREAARYAPRAPDRFTWLRRLLGIAVVVGVVWVAAAAAWAWSQDQFYVGQQNGTVVVYRGLDASLPGLDLSKPYETTNVELDRLSDFEAQNVREGIDASSLADARKTVESLAEKMSPAEAPADTGEPS
jgi:serine/threonine protein phosphatase PrpC